MTMNFSFVGIGGTGAQSPSPTRLVVLHLVVVPASAARSSAATACWSSAATACWSFAASACWSFAASAWCAHAAHGEHDPVRLVHVPVEHLSDAGEAKLTLDALHELVEISALRAISLRRL